MSEPTYGLIGSGRVATHLGHYLELEGQPLARWDRRASEPPERALAGSEPILLAISDDALETFLTANSWLAGRTVVHFSGSLVLAGAHGRTLAWGPGHLDGTAAPGTPGQSVVTAHRDTHFRFLERVAIGDGLVVERADGVRVGYRVVATRVADESQLDIPREVDRPTLTLVTCWPFDAVAPGGPLRYVVVAEASVPATRRMMADASSRR